VRGKGAGGVLEDLEIRMNWKIPWVHFGKVPVAFGIDVSTFFLSFGILEICGILFLGGPVWGLVTEAAYVCLVILRLFSPLIFLGLVWQECDE
jgi:hypothetical protein